MRAIKPSELRDQAQSIAEKIRPMLIPANDYELKLNGTSTVWLKDINGSGYVAWSEDNLSWDSKFTRTVLPELRQPVSGADRLPDEAELRAFIAATRELVK